MAWFTKELPTFRDTLAFVRQHCWPVTISWMSSDDADCVKILKVLLNRLMDALPMPPERPIWIKSSLEYSAKFCLLINRVEITPRLWGAAEALRKQIGVTMWPVDRTEYERRVAEARQQCQPEAWEASWAAGRTMGWEQASQEALPNGRGLYTRVLCYRSAIMPM